MESIRKVWHRKHGDKRQGGIQAEIGIKDIYHEIRDYPKGWLGHDDQPGGRQ